MLYLFETTRNITSSGTLQLNDAYIYADASSGDLTITLLPAAQTLGLTYRIYKSDSSGNSIIIDGDGSETINGNSQVVSEIQSSSSSSNIYSSSSSSSESNVSLSSNSSLSSSSS